MFVHTLNFIMNVWFKYACAQNVNVNIIDMECCTEEAPFMS